MASGRWSAPSSSSTISARCSSSPARAWTCARIRISGSPPSPICSTAAIMHRDSEGNVQEIQPGAMNLMTAGRGIAHSERTPDVQRAQRPEDAGPAELDRAAGRLGGNRAVVPALRRRQPADHARTAASPRASIAGTAFGVNIAGVAWCRHWFYAEVARRRPAPARRSIPTMRSARSIVVDGEVEIAGDTLRRPAPADLPARRPHHREGHAADAHDVPRAATRWKGRGTSGGISSPPARSASSRPKRTGKPAASPHVPHEHEFIPLPE